MKLSLRGHHLLCLKGFQGYGYDETFTENMSEINQKRKLKETTISLTDSIDDICAACPNRKNDFCESKSQNDRIVQMDRKVLKKLNSTKEYNSVGLFEKLDEIFNTKESVSEICFECIWHEKCLFYQNLSNHR